MIHRAQSYSYTPVDRNEAGHAATFKFLRRVCKTVFSITPECTVCTYRIFYPKHCYADVTDYAGTPTPYRLGANRRQSYWKMERGMFSFTVLAGGCTSWDNPKTQMAPLSHILQTHRGADIG
jgi:hypothetical protein